MRVLPRFFTAQRAGTAASAGEHEVLWMSPESARAELFHECHAWAIERALSGGGRRR